MRICPNCKKAQDAQAWPAHVEPEPGDISICSCCAQVNVFEQDMSLRPIITEELKELLMNWPDSFGQVVQAVSYIKNKSIFNYSKQ